MKKHQKGFSLIELLIVVAIIGILAAVAIPNLLAARRAANEAAAISALRTISGAQASYKVGNTTFASLAQLNAAGLIDEVLGCPTQQCPKSGYNYSTLGTAGFAATRWDATAMPLISTGIARTGTRFFYTNESGVIYANVGSAPTVDVNRVVSNGSPAD